MVLAAGIEVVIDAPDTDFFESANLVLAHQAQGAADIDADFCTNFFHGFRDFVNFFVRWTAPAIDDAVAYRSGFFGALGAFHELFLREEWITIDGRVGYGRLRAVVAILGTQAAFCVLEHVDLYPFAEIMMTHFEGCADKLRDLFVRRVEHGFHFLALGNDALKSFVCQ